MSTLPWVWRTASCLCWPRHMHMALNTKNPVSPSQLLQVSYLSLLLSLKVFVLSESPWSLKVSFKRQCSAPALLGSSGLLFLGFHVSIPSHILWSSIENLWQSRVVAQDIMIKKTILLSQPRGRLRIEQIWAWPLQKSCLHAFRILWKRLLYISSWSGCFPCTVVYCRHNHSPSYNELLVDECDLICHIFF